MRTRVGMFENLQLKGLCVGDLLYMYTFVCMYMYTWRRKWHPTPVLLPGESHGGRSLVGYSPWGRKESDTTELLNFHLQTAMKRREVKGKGEKERYKHLNAEFQRIVRRDKKPFSVINAKK